MEVGRKLSIQLELLFWLFTAVLALAFIYPIYKTGSSFPFYTLLLTFIVTFVTFTRYLFLLKFTFLAFQKWTKALLIVCSIPLVFYLISELNMFQTFIDEEGLDQFFRFMPLVDRIELTDYIRNVMIFFGTASIIVNILFPFRLLISIWRNVNKQTV